MGHSLIPHPIVKKIPDDRKSYHAVLRSMESDAHFKMITGLMPVALMLGVTSNPYVYLALGAGTLLNLGYQTIFKNTRNKSKIRLLTYGYLPSPL